MSDAAFALWVRAGSYCANKATDGFVADDVLSLFTETQQAAAPELVRRRLWSRVRGGFQYHQFDERNLTKARIEADRKRDREKKRRQRATDEASSSAHREGNEHSSANGYPQASKTDDRSTSEAKDQRNGSDVPPGHPRDSPGDSGGSPTGSVSVSVSESVSGSGHVPAAVEPAAPEPQEPPPPACPQHLEDPDPPPCGRCADARRRRARWDAGDAERRRTQPKCPKHRGQPAHNCAGCRADALAGDR